MEVRHSWKYPLLSGILVFLFIFCDPGSSSIQLYAQDDTAVEEGVRLLGLSVQGNQTASAAQIIANSGLRVDQTLYAETIQKAIQRIYDIGLFSDVKILVEQQSANAVYLIIRVEEWPRLGTMNFRGNKKIKKNKFSEELDLLPGQVLSDYDIHQAAKKVKSMYKEKNFLLAEVDTLLQPVADREGYVDLTFRIDEGRKVKIQDIEFHGNEAFSDGKLRRQMDKVKEQRWWKFFQDVEYSPENFIEDKQLVEEFYKSNGYRDAEVMRDSIYYDEEKTRMFIDLWVEEGSVYTYSDFTWNGNTLYTDEELQRALGLQAGDTYNFEQFQTGTENISKLYMDRGYLYFQMNPQEVPVGETEVRVDVQVQENYQVSVRRIDITGNTKTKEDVIRRELQIFPGDVFSQEKLMRSQRELFILNYFSNIVPDVVPVDEKQVDLEIEVEEKQTDRANASIGYSELDKLLGSVGLEFNNFMGNGQRLSFSYQRARYFQSFNFSFNEPWPWNRPNPVGVSVFYSERGAATGGGYLFGSRASYYLPFDYTTRGASLSLGHRFRWPDNYFRGNWTFYMDSKRYTAIKDSTVFRYWNPSGVNPTYGIRFTQVIQRDSRDRPEFPTQGSKVSLRSTLSGGPLGGNEEYHKHNFQIEWFSPLPLKFVLYTDIELGAMKALYSGAVIPYEDLFYMGGEGLVYGTALRGYDERSVGPISSRGNAIGARALMKYSLELRFLISENPTIYGLGFFESGNTFLNVTRMNPFDLKRSVGVGGRVFMQMLGMLGVDVGYGFDPLVPGREPSGWKTHFVFGQSF